MFTKAKLVNTPPVTCIFYVFEGNVLKLLCSATFQQCIFMMSGHALVQRIILKVKQDDERGKRDDKFIQNKNNNESFFLFTAMLEALKSKFHMGKTNLDGIVIYIIRSVCQYE